MYLKHNDFRAMTPQELKNAIRKKTMELDFLIEQEKPHIEIRKIYKELKELQYQLVYAELPRIESDSQDEKVA